MASPPAAIPLPPPWRWRISTSSRSAAWSNTPRASARISWRGCKGSQPHPYVGEARGVGLIGALEFVADKATKAGFAKPGAVGARLAELAHEEGLIIRAIGDVIAFCPPLVIERGEVDDMFDRFGAGARAVAA